MTSFAGFFKEFFQLLISQYSQPVQEQGSQPVNETHPAVNNFVNALKPILTTAAEAGAIHLSDKYTGVEDPAFHAMLAGTVVNVLNSTESALTGQPALPPAPAPVQEPSEPASAVEGTQPPQTQAQ